MENVGKCIDDMLDAFDKKLIADTGVDISSLPIEVEGSDRRVLENNPYAE